MTTAKPPARYGAIWGRASGRLCSTELHDHSGHAPGPLVLREDTYRKAQLIHRLTERYACGGRIVSA